MLPAAAEPLEIPELGVRIADLPAASVPEVTDQLVGYLASFRMGKVEARVMRLSEPVPASASFASRSYRDGLHEYFGDRQASHEGPTTVAGHDAWSMCSAEARADSNVDWHCTYYLISEQHLYRLAVFAASPQKPPEFDAIIRAFYGMSFEPARPAIGPEGQPVVRPRQFLYRMTAATRNQYPMRAKARSEQGAVDVEFSLDARGHPRDLRTTYADADALSTPTSDFLSSLVFRVPADWETSGAAMQRFTFEAQYSLVTRGQPCPPPAAPTRIAGATLVLVCGTEIPPGAVER
jgi:hypothetical protein